ncbi:hypothetical protein Tcan_00681, partial [Toxocara canis]
MWVVNADNLLKRLRCSRNSTSTITYRIAIMMSLLTVDRSHSHRLPTADVAAAAASFAIDAPMALHSLASAVVIRIMVGRSLQLHPSPRRTLRHRQHLSAYHMPAHSGSHQTTSTHTHT